MSDERAFPIRVSPASVEEVRIEGPGFCFVVCAHGARALAAKLIRVADHSYCDGYRHGDEATMFCGSNEAAIPNVGGPRPPEG